MFSWCHLTRTSRRSMPHLIVLNLQSVRSRPRSGTMDSYRMPRPEDLYPYLEGGRLEQGFLAQAHGVGFLVIRVAVMIDIHTSLDRCKDRDHQRNEVQLCRAGRSSRPIMVTTCYLPNICPCLSIYYPQAPPRFT